jgi:hypothetical protein
MIEMPINPFYEHVFFRNDIIYSRGYKVKPALMLIGLIAAGCLILLNVNADTDLGTLLASRNEPCGLGH